MIVTECKPCPFCKDADPQVDEVSPGIHALVCQGCGAIGPCDTNIQQTAEQAIAAWNGRSA